MPKNKLKLYVGCFGNVYADRNAKNGVMSSRREDVTESFKEALLLFMDNEKWKTKIEHNGRKFEIVMRELEEK